MPDGSPLANWLRAKGAHHDWVTWAEPYGADWQRAWQECARGDWLLAWLVALEHPRHEVVRAALKCAETSFDVLPDDLQAPRAALHVGLRWADGTAEDDDARASRDDVERLASSYPDPAVATALGAVAAALHAIDDLEHAPGAAANAAQSAVFAVGDCAMMAALHHAHHQCAEAVRSLISWDSLRFT